MKTRSLPLVSGAVILTFGLVVFVSTFRQTRTHVYRAVHGEADFALDVPRSWGLSDVPTRDSRIEWLHGRLPSGGEAQLALQTEAWAAGGEQDGQPTFFLPQPKRVPAGPLGIMFMTGRIVRGPIAMTATAVAPEELTEADRALLDHCLRSMRWIGR